MHMKHLQMHMHCTNLLQLHANATAPQMSIEYVYLDDNVQIWLMQQMHQLQ